MKEASTGSLWFWKTPKPDPTASSSLPSKATLEWLIRWPQSLANPGGIAPAIQDGVDVDRGSLYEVVEGKGKSSDQHPVKAVSSPMDSPGDAGGEPGRPAGAAL